MENKTYKVGDTFKPKRSKTEYTVVATFEDNGEHFFVAKKPSNYEGWYYSNIFYYDEEGKIKQRN